MGGRPLVGDISNLIWEHPLVANYGNLAMGQHLAVDLSSPLLADFSNFA